MGSVCAARRVALVNQDNTGQQKPSVARKRFLDAARKEFAAKGYAGASIRSIARSLHMRESAFYAHFKSKQEAYDAILHEAGPDVMAVYVGQIDATGGPQVELAKLAQQAMRAWTSPEVRVSTSILLRDIFGEGGGKRQQLLKGVSSALDVLQAIFEVWQQEGHVPRKLDARTLAFQFVAPLITTRLLFFSAGSSASERKLGQMVVDKHVQGFLQLLSTKPGT